MTMDLGVHVAREREKECCFFLLPSLEERLGQLEIDRGLDRCERLSFLEKLDRENADGDEAAIQKNNTVGRQTIEARAQ
jgi:hypothetical protein